MRSLALIAVVGLACTTLAAAPAVADVDPAPCTWVVSKVLTPDGYNPDFTQVQGTDSHGNYAGTSLRPGANTFDLVLWTNGQPRVVDGLQHLLHLQMADENSAGTVLFSAGWPAQQRTVAMLYSGGHQGAGSFTELVPPAGYRVSGVTALNERGDALGRGERISDGQAVSLLWSTLAAGPIVIDSSLGAPTDLDDDGTVLLSGRDSRSASLWRNGQVTPLAADPSKQLFVEAIRNGKVVGYQVESPWPDSQSLLWDTDGNVRYVEDGGTAFAINAGGLITGERSTMTGKASVWRDTTFLGELPVPDGVTFVSELFVAGDDNSLYSKASNYGPLRWNCRPEVGDPS
ncbi:hypothetical protein ACWGE0_05095 [Lentzea sp. NPDC054927]